MVTSFASDGSPFGSGLFQLTPKSVRSIFVLRLRPMRSFPWGIGDRRGHRPGHRDRLGGALDGQLAVDRDLPVAVESDVLGCEAELRVPLCVEEVGRLEMG